MTGIAKAGAGVAAKAVGALMTPAHALREARTALTGVGEIAWAGMNPAPPTPLNVEIGPHRRFVGVRCELKDFKDVKNAFGGTVNDVVLTVVAGALRHWLHTRGVRTRGPRAARARPRVRPRGARARAHGQPDRGHARPAAGVRRGPGRAPARRQRGDGRP